MTTITSPHNPRLKELRKLTRARERARSGLFAVEGEDLVLAAQHAGRRAVEGFHAPGVNVGEERFHEVSPTALAAVSALASGTRVIAVYEQRWSAPSGQLCVYLHGVSDPGNVGTVLRAAAAFGAACVALGPGCADPHSPKAVRASMGAIFAVRLARVREMRELPGRRVALVAHAGEPLWRLEECRKALTRGSGAPTTGRQALTLLVGSERAGLPDEVVGACEHVAHIPIASDSLNAAMAATVALYELTRPSTRVPA
jgi:TrmH family RNA methyltransferase